MHESEFSEVVDDLCTGDPRYDAQAYYFIREALDFAVRMHKKRPEGTTNPKYWPGASPIRGLCARQQDDR